MSTSCGHPVPGDSDSVRAKGTASLPPPEARRVQRDAPLRDARLAERYRPDGAAAFIHGNRDRAPVNRTDPAIRARLVELATTEFAGFNPVHLAEILAEEGH